MKTEVINIHPDNPQPRFIKYVAGKITSGAIFVLPTDSGFSIGSALENKSGVEKIRRIRNLSKRHDFTLMLQSLSQIGEFAKVDNDAFRILKRTLPGQFTFILEATREVPNRLVHPKKKTIGIRVPNKPLIKNLIEELGEPIICVSLIIDGVEFVNTQDVIDKLQNQIDIVIDSGFCLPTPTTVIDFTRNPYEIVRYGAGDTSSIFG
jgi:tRNA threonylcarbamoyl adenosine modification protein (Sua5/YciO/YrdC/YwlC family)